MSENRATKSGLALDAQKKIQSKYDQAKAAECMAWIADTLNLKLDTSGTCESVYDQLKDGKILISLLQAICPEIKLSESVKKDQTLSFKIREKIDVFLSKIKEPPLEINDLCVFATVDLFECQNICQVITCLEAVGRRCYSVNTPVKGFGPKEAVANKREFSKEQLDQGKTVIGLQMGSNKGATQSGQNFGKGRQITD